MNVKKAIAAKERKNIRERLSNLRFKSISLDELLSGLADDGLTLLAFKENISKLFPLVLSLVHEGHSLPAIERLMRMRPRSLVQFIERTPMAFKMVKEARQIRSDKALLDEMLS